MADTNTPNILLLLPDLNDTFNFSAHVEANFTTIDGLMGAVDCTSTARPSNTYKGQIVYEHDSLRYAQNTGSKATPAWTYMSHAALAVTSSTHPTSGLSTGELIYETDTKFLQAYNGSSFEQKAYTNYTTTSSAHPSGPFTGLEIYETDTGLSAVYNGSAYQYGVQQAASTVTLGSTTASVTFSGLPAVNGFMVKWAARCSDAVAAEMLDLQFNGVSTASYTRESNEANNNSAVSGNLSGGATSIQVGTVVAASATANYWSTGAFEVDTGGTGRYTTVAGYGVSVATTSNAWAGVYGGLFASTNTITSLTLFGASGSFVTGSKFSIYALP